MKKFKNKILIFIIIISIIRIFMGYLIPTFYFENFYHDDLLSLNISKSLYNLEWLGSYSSITLVKGFVFPFMMAVFKLLNLNIGIGLSIFYVLSCALFCHAIKDYFKNKKTLYLLYILLIFNPVSFSSETFQRLYRNSISYSLVLFILSFLFLFYKTKFNDKKIYFYLIFLGLSLLTFMFSREDYIWIFPVVILIFIIKLIKDFSFLNVIKLMIPIIVVLSSQFIVKSINYSYYDIFTLNELNDSNYKKAYLELLKIKPDKYYNRVSIPKTSLSIAFDNSPTLSLIKPEIIYSTLDSGENGGLIDGYMIWNLRRIAQDKGIYSNSNNAEDFWSNVYKELKDARLDKKYETRFVLPSMLISPVTKNNMIEFIKMLPDSFIYVFTYKGFNVYSYNDLLMSKIEVNKGEFYNNSLNLTINDNKNTDNFGKIKNDIISKFFNYLISFYRVLAIILNIIGIFSFLILLLNKKFNKLLIPLTVIIGFMFLLCGVTYTHVSAFDAIRYFYLSPAYILFIIFSFSSIFSLIEEVNNERS